MSILALTDIDLAKRLSSDSLWCLRASPAPIFLLAMSLSSKGTSIIHCYCVICDVIFVATTEVGVSSYYLSAEELQLRDLMLMLHHKNKSVQRIPPYTPLLYSKTGVYRVPFFLFLL